MVGYIDAKMHVWNAEMQLNPIIFRADSINLFYLQVQQKSCKL